MNTDQKESPLTGFSLKPKTRSVSDEEKKEVFFRFMEVVKTMKSRSSFYDNLNDNQDKPGILSIIRRKCWYRVFEVTDVPGVYLIFLNGNSDATLIQWASLCGFPRGYAVLFDFTNGKILSDSGFLPKFVNDPHGASPIDYSIFINVIKAKITKKFSGFLTGAVLYKNDRNEATFSVVSKKSADPESKFVSLPYALWGNMLTPKAIEALLEQGITTLWGECLHKQDQAHGSLVVKNAIVITAAGKSSWASDNGNPTSVTNDDLKKILSPHGLDQYMVSPYVITCEDTIKQLGLKLSQQRDIMSDNLFNKIMQEYGFRINYEHEQILGNRLEGIIIQMLTKDGWKTLKYKFTPYVVLTMFLRQTSDSGKKKLGVYENGKYRLLPSTVDAIENFVSRWVFNPENNDYYRGYCLRLSEIQDSMDDTDDPVAKWIRADQQISTETVKPVSKEELELSILSSSRNVICVVAPVGYGKSSFADTLCQHLNEKNGTDQFVLIDGDKCGFIPNLPEDALVLGQERNSVFLAIILKLLSEGKTPVIPCGGGVLRDGFGPKSKFIFDGLTKTLGVCVKPVFFTPPDNSLTDENLKKWVEDAVKYRRSEGLYKDQPNIDKVLFGVSKSNLKILDKITESYETYKFDHAKNGVCQIPDILPDLLGNSEALPLKVNQLRHLVEIDSKYYHQTLYYNYREPMEFQYDPSEQPFTSQLPLYEVKELKGKKEKVVLALVLTKNGHVTVSSGPFQPKLMGDVEKFLRDTSQNELVLRGQNVTKTLLRSEFAYRMVPVTFVCKFGF